MFLAHFPSVTVSLKALPITSQHNQLHLVNSVKETYWLSFKLLSFSLFNLCYWSVLVRTHVCRDDFGTALVTFSPSGKAWLCHSQSLQTSAASIRALLAFSPSLGCSAEPFGKDVSILGLLPASIVILSLRLLLLRSFLALSLSMPCFLLFGKLILLMWWECHEFSTLPLGFLAWPSTFF